MSIEPVQLYRTIHLVTLVERILEEWIATVATGGLEREETAVAFAKEMLRLTM